MRRIRFFALLILAAAAGYWFFFRDSSGPKPPKTPPIQVRHHSDSFNRSIDSLIAPYMLLGDALGLVDTVQAKQYAKQLIARCQQISLAELEQDSSGIAGTVRVQLGDMEANTQSLLIQTDIQEMRQDYRMVSESLYPLLKTIAFAGKPLNWYTTADPFGPGTEASWLGWRTEPIRNPFYGKAHPKMGDQQWHQGELKDSIIPR